jgi:hypothetical protein
MGATREDAAAASASGREQLRQLRFARRAPIGRAIDYKGVPCYLCDAFSHATVPVPRHGRNHADWWFSTMLRVAANIKKHQRINLLAFGLRIAIPAMGRDG